jgi:hypothetical protein
VLAHVWAWYQQITPGLRSTSAGVPSLTWADLQAWQQLTANTINAFECGCLFALHNAWATAVRQAKG